MSLDKRESVVPRLLFLLWGNTWGHEPRLGLGKKPTDRGKEMFTLTSSPVFLEGFTSLRMRKRFCDTHSRCLGGSVGFQEKDTESKNESNDSITCKLFEIKNTRDRQGIEFFFLSFTCNNIFHCHSPLLYLVHIHEHPVTSIAASPLRWWCLLTLHPNNYLSQRLRCLKAPW